MGNRNNKEIERKFLIDCSDIHLEKLPFKRIRQGYLCFEEEREVRIRTMDHECYLTYKRGGGLVRNEVEFSLERTVFEDLWSQTEGRRLEKIRYYMNYQKYVIEIDRYLGSLEGLTVAEVEFSSKEEAENFVPPLFLFRDISGISVFRNRTLIFDGLPGELI